MDNSAICPLAEQSLSERKEELFKLKTAKQNVASFFREEEPAQQER